MPVVITTFEVHKYYLYLISQPQKGGAHLDLMTLYKFYANRCNCVLHYTITF